LSGAYVFIKSLMRLEPITFRLVGSTQKFRRSSERGNYLGLWDENWIDYCGESSLKMSVPDFKRIVDQVGCKEIENENKMKRNEVEYTTVQSD
jgi:hypothetical protein